MILLHTTPTILNLKYTFKVYNRSADKTLASHQLIYENDFVGSTRNALARQNHCDRRMIEEDSSSRRWHRSHRLQSHVRSKGWQLRWITTRHMVSSKRQSRCRQWITLYIYIYMCARVVMILFYYTSKMRVQHDLALIV